MPELIDAGYVYIAKPPLYRVKNGKQEIYVEKESELEELLLRDKLEEFEIVDARRQAAQAHARARWQRFNRRLKEYEGWADSLQAEFGHDAGPTSSPSRRSSTPARATLAGVKKLLDGRGPRRASRSRPSSSRSPTTGSSVKAIHRRSGLARIPHACRAELFDVDRLPAPRRGPRRPAEAGRPAAVRGRRSASEPRGATRSTSCAARCSSSPATASRCSASRASAR